MVQRSWDVPAFGEATRFPRVLAVAIQIYAKPSRRQSNRIHLSCTDTGMVTMGMGMDTDMDYSHMMHLRLALVECVPVMRFE